MARRIHTANYQTEDGTVEVTVQALGGITGSQLGIKLMSIFGPSMVGLIAAMEKDDPAAIMACMREMLGKLGPNDFKALLKEVLTGAQAKQGNEFVDVTVEWVDEAFGGAPGSVFKLTFDAIKVNFSNFSQELGFGRDLLTKLGNAMRTGAMKAMAKAAGAK